MAKQFPLNPGSWLRVEALVEQGDPEFAEELRRIQDVDRLGSFAKVLYNDRRATTRRLMIQYLQLPFNAFRHEALLKRLFKLAEAAQDDEVMAYFMVGLDRCIRREKRSRNRYDWSSRESWVEESVRTPRGTELPRKGNSFVFQNRITGLPMAAPSPEKHDRMFLFSLATRKYLRRRVWRYFRKIGKLDADRYKQAIRHALVLYTDQDCKDGLAMLDNWSLVHALFKNSDTIAAKSRSWKLVESRSLSELRAAPAFLNAWNKNAEPLMGLLDDARCRPVRQWAMDLLREQHTDALNKSPIDRLLPWIRSTDDGLARFGADLLHNSNRLGTIQVKTWLELVREANPSVLDVLCKLMFQTLSPDVVSLRDAVDMACSRSIAIAELGMQWLEPKEPTSDQDIQDLLLTLEAQSEAIRPKLVDRVRLKLDRIERMDITGNRTEWILEYLDSRHSDVRDIGWAWLQQRDQIAKDYHLWQRLIETPYDDLRLKVIQLLHFETLEPSGSPLTPAPSRDIAMLIDASQLPTDRIRFLWASALLNVYRGGKQKPGIVKAIVARLHSHSDETKELMPILAVALRSVRSMEWQAGLAGIVSLVEKKTEVLEWVRTHFPELNLL
jgi:hypothetical protein